MSTQATPQETKATSATHALEAEASRTDQAKNSLSNLVSQHIELAGAEIKPAAAAAGKGSALGAAGAVFLLHTVWMLVIVFALLIGWAFDAFTDLSTGGSYTLGFAIAALISAIIGLVLFLIARGQFKKVKKPEATIAEAKATVDAVGHALARFNDTTPSPRGELKPSAATRVDRSPNATGAQAAKPAHDRPNSGSGFDPAKARTHLHGTAAPAARAEKGPDFTTGSTVAARPDQD